MLITWGKVYFERILCYSGLLKMIWAKMRDFLGVEPELGRSKTIFDVVAKAAA